MGNVVSLSIATKIGQSFKNDRNETSQWGFKMAADGLNGKPHLLMERM